MRSRHVIGASAMATVAGVLVAAVAAQGQSIDYEPTPYGLFLPNNVRLAQIAGDTAWPTAPLPQCSTEVAHRMAVLESMDAWVGALAGIEELLELADLGSTEWETDLRISIALARSTGSDLRAHEPPAPQWVEHDRLLDEAIDLVDGSTGIMETAVDRDDGALLDTGIIVYASSEPLLQDAGAHIPPSCTNSTPTMPADNYHVQIDAVFFDSPALEETSGEYVTISNHGPGPANMQGWSLYDDEVLNGSGTGLVYVFPNFSLAVGASVRVWTCTGTDTATDLYNGVCSPVWDNQGDTAVLRKADGSEVARLGY